MALIDKASLLMVPSVYEDGTLYNILPSGNKAPDETGNHNGYDQTRADFTFSRGSNLAATRVNSSGLIEKGRENLLTYSNDFSNASWNKSSSITFTSGQSGYDGSSNAWNAIPPASTGNSAFYQNNTSNLATSSIYAKYNGYHLRIRVGGTGGNRAYATFDLQNGTIGNSGGTAFVDAEITSIGGDWYRCSLTKNYSTAGFAEFQISENATDGDNPSWTPNGTSGIYIQDAQLEAGLVATDYIETGATTATAGILEDMPRINYDANGENGALLLEPSRTNLVTYSEYLNGSIWNQSACSVTDNDATSPEGVTNAAKVEGDGTATQIRFYDNYTFPSTGNYVLSVFAKAGNNDFIALAFKGVTGGITAYYDLSEGTTSDTTNGTIEAVGTDGWYRCTLKANLTGPDLTGNYNMYVARNLTTTTFASAGDADGKYVHAWGFQLEAGSYPSSLIPTHGAAVTRGADSTYPPSSYITNNVGNSGSWFMEYEDFRFVVTGTSAPTNRLGDGSNSNCLGMAARVVNNDLRINFIKAESGVVTTLADHDITGAFKCVFVWDGSNLSLYVNGSQRYSAAGFTQPSWSSLVFNNTSREGFQMLKQNILFDEALTQSEAEALTTL